MVSLVQANKSEVLSFAGEIEGRLERRRFSIKGILTILVLLPIFPVIFPLMMWIANYQERKLEELWENEGYAITNK